MKLSDIKPCPIPTYFCIFFYLLLFLSKNLDIFILFMPKLSKTICQPMYFSVTKWWISRVCLQTIGHYWFVAVIKGNSLITVISLESLTQIFTVSSIAIIFRRPTYFHLNLSIRIFDWRLLRKIILLIFRTERMCYKI